MKKCFPQAAILLYLLTICSCAEEHRQDDDNGDSKTSIVIDEVDTAYIKSAKFIVIDEVDTARIGKVGFIVIDEVDTAKVIINPGKDGNKNETDDREQ